MPLNLQSTLITFHETLAPKNDPDLARDNQIPMLPLHTSSAIQVSGGTLELGIFEVQFTQLLRMSLYRCTHRENIFYFS